MDIIIDITFFGMWKPIELTTLDILFLKAKIHNYSNRIILTALLEDWDPAEINVILDMLQITYDQPNVLLVVESPITLVDSPWNQKLKIKNIVSYNWNVIHAARGQESYQCNTTTNLDSDKILYFMGKPYKRHRIGLLYQMYKRNLLPKSVYSFHLAPLSDNIKQATRNKLSEIDDQEYQTFITDAENTLDVPIDQFYQSNNNILYLGFPTDPNLYKKTCVSLVTETKCTPKQPYHLSEKLFRAIFNHHPFVLVGYNKTYEFLHQLGFDTFQYVMKHHCMKFDDSLTVDEIMSLALDNIEYFIEHKHEYADRILCSIENNISAWNTLVTENRNKVLPTIEDDFWNPFFLKTDYITELNYDGAKTAIDHLWNKISGADGED